MDDLARSRRPIATRWATLWRGGLPAVIVVLVAGALLRVPLLDRPASHDEIYNSLSYLAPHRLGSTGGWSQDWSRQIVIHPPGVSLFYSAWIRLVGDSPIALHVPALLAGLLSLVLALLLARRFLPSHLALLYTLTVGVSGSHVVHSVSAVHAIFELAALQGALLALAVFIDSRRRRGALVFAATMGLCVLVFYHGFVLLLLAAEALWLMRRALRLPRWPFALTALICSAFVAMVLSRLGHHHYGYSFWNVNTWAHLVGVARDLPFRELGESVQGYEMVRWILLLLAMVGSVVPALTWRMVQPARFQRGERLMGLVLVGVWVAPFVAYWTISLVHPRFGEPRNFFYLLPVSLLFAFRAVALASATAMSRSATVAATFVGTGLAAAVLWVSMSQPNALGLSRYAHANLLRAAASVDEGAVLYVSPIRGVAADSRRAEQYYRRILGMDDRVRRVASLDRLDDAAYGIVGSERPWALVRFAADVGDPLGPITTAAGRLTVERYRAVPGALLPYYVRPRRTGRDLVQWEVLNQPTTPPSGARRGAGRSPTRSSPRQR